MARSFRLLSSLQLHALRWLLGGTAFLLANSVYLWFATHVGGEGERPGELSVVYQTALMLHVALGLLLVPAAVAFALWHLKRALDRKRPGAIRSGVGVVVSALLLLLTGLFIFTEANSRTNAWASIGHQLLAVALPLLYALHRLRSVSRPDRRIVGRAVVTVASLTLLFTLSHVVESLGAEAGAAAAAGPNVLAERRVFEHLPHEDPFVPFAGSAEIRPDAPFFPSATTLESGSRAPSDLLHLGEAPTPEEVREAVANQGFYDEKAIGAESCRECHADIVAQWESSAHRFASLNNPFYVEAVELTIETHGSRRGQWCAGCHDPALLVSGEFLEGFDAKSSPAGQVGISCMACHAIDKLHGVQGNGGYQLANATPSPYLFANSDSALLSALNRYLVRAKPTAHKARLIKPFFQTSEYCATCHKVSFEEYLNDYKWLRGQNEYDAWADSGVPHNNPMTWYEPKTTRTCQDCHMPREEAVLGDLAKDESGMVRSHRFAAANTALPHLRGDEDMVRRIEEVLRDAMRIEVFALRVGDELVMNLAEAAPKVAPGAVVQVDVVVRNKGVGHAFPGGTVDSNEGWIDFQVKSGDRVIWHSGALGPHRVVDPDAHFYKAMLVDSEGELIDRRNALDIHTPVYANTVGPSTSDVARYRFRVPDDLEGEDLSIEATLRWRKFNRFYTEFSFPDRPAPDLPITDMARHAVQVGVGQAPAGPARPGQKVPTWTRYNDYGIGSVLDGDTRTALRAFEEVARLAPERPDGPRNQARAHLRDGRLDLAENALREAARRAPDDVRTAFFWGRLLEERGGEDLPRAAEAYARVLQKYARSRGTWDRVATVAYLEGRFADAIEAALEVLEIDPEHARAHWQRLRAYRQLAARAEDPAAREELEFAVREAERAFEKYKPDEDAQARSLGFRQRHPAAQRMSQSIVVHEQPE